MQDKQRLDAYVQAALSNSEFACAKYTDTWENVYKIAKGMMDYVDAQQSEGSSDWVNNTGVMPDSGDKKIIVVFRNGEQGDSIGTASRWTWALEGSDYDIIKWKLAE